MPWIAGLFALACQVRPAITPEIFWRGALSTGKTIRLTRGAQPIEFGTMAHPVALVERLQAMPRPAAAAGGGP